MDFYKIHLPFWPLQSQEEQSHRETVISFGGVPLSAPLLAVEPSAHTSKQAQCCLSESPTGYSAETGPRLSVLFWSSRTTFREDAALSAPGTSIRIALPQWPLQSGRTAPWRGGREHFWADFLLSAAGQRRPGSGPQWTRAFSFPQLVTQGSSVQGLSNKLTIQSKHVSSPLSHISGLWRGQETGLGTV